MILSQSEEAVGHWWSSEGDVGDPRHHRGEIVAPVEPVFEFGEVTGHMLVTDGTVGASDRALDVSEGSVDPLKGGHQGGAATRSGNGALFRKPDAISRSIGQTRSPKPSRGQFGFSLAAG